MTESPLAKKLLVRADCRILVLNAPEAYVERLEPLPEGARVSTDAASGRFDQVHLFVGHRSALERDAGTALGALEPGGILWACYPKGAPGADLNRDRGWKALWDRGWQQVSQVSVDDRWSALRFRPLAETGEKR